jgi:hypothetical protein
LDFKLCPPYSAGHKGGRPWEEKQIKGALEIAIDKTEKKKKTAETGKSVTQLSQMTKWNIGP